MQIEAIETARLLPGATRAQEGNDGETWKGVLATESGERPIVYVKRQPAPAMCAEFVAALSGRALGMPIPKPYLTLIKRQDLPESALWADGQEYAHAFALADAEGISFRQWLRRDSERAMAIFAAWDRYQDTAYFDEWIANTDRHHGNVLFDGQYWLIDHGRALNVPAWPAFPLDPGAAYGNLLLAKRLPSLSQHERYQWRRDGTRFAAHCQAVPVAEIAGQLTSTDPGLAADALLFLQNRASHLVSLLCQRMNIPELELVGPD